MTIYNICVIIPIKKEIKEEGLHMEVPKRNTAIFTSPDEKERVVIKKAVISALSNPTSVICPKINFTEAVLKEPPMYFSMPKECIEKLRKAYSESIKK